MELKDRGQLFEAFGTYYDRFKDAVWNRIRRRLSGYGNPMKQKMKDLHQDIFFGAWNWMNNFWEENNQIPSEDLFKKALYKIELRRNDYIADHIDQMGHEIHVADDYRLVDESNSRTADLLELRTADSSPEKKLQLSESLDRLLVCLEALGEKERSAILYKVDGHSDKEIAAFLDKDQSTVTHSIIPQARKKLRRCMEGYINGNGPTRRGF